MDPKLIWLIVGIVAAMGIVAAAIVIWRARVTRERRVLRHRFGPEYERLVEQHHSETSARRELRRRVVRMRRFSLRDLSPASQEKYEAEWQRVQAQFVDDPKRAALDADQLIHRVMLECGYPMDGGLDQRIADLSVHHPNVVQHYRAVRALTQGVESGRAETEDLRQAMVHYRALFADLLRAPFVPGQRLIPREVPA